VPEFKEATAPGDITTCGDGGTRPGIFFANLRDMMKCLNGACPRLPIMKEYLGIIGKFQTVEELKDLPHLERFRSLPT